MAGLRWEGLGMTGGAQCGWFEMGVGGCDWRGSLWLV